MSAPVGICCSSGDRNITAILAAFKSHRPYVPLDPSSAERLRFIVDDARVGVVVTDRAMVSACRIPCALLSL